MAAPRAEVEPPPAGPEPRARPAVTLRVASRPVDVDAAHQVLDVEPQPTRVPPAHGDEQHILVSPVEMWFGDFRIGVKPGTKTFAEFQRLAGILFDDLRSARAS